VKEGYVVALIIVFAIVFGWGYFSQKTPETPTVCVSLPKEVALWGVNVHDTGAGLYLCFQQGVENNRTETKCVPMTKEKCSK
jgi:hypothetical protein